MTDLLERMKAYVTSPDTDLPPACLLEAIAEIERLRKEKQELQNLYDHLRSEYMELIQNR